MYIYISNTYILHFKYISILFVNYISRKLGGGEEEEEARVFGLKSRKLSVISILILAMTLPSSTPVPVTCSLSS